jgi:hypothetical protein
LEIRFNFVDDRAPVKRKLLIERNTGNKIKRRMNS